MGFFRSLFSRPEPKDSRGLYLYLQCGQCSEKLRTRVDLQSELSLQYGDSRKGDTYHARKLIVGEAQCFRRIEIQLTFDRNRNLIDKEASGGVFITAKEFRSDQGDD